MIHEKYKGTRDISGLSDKNEKYCEGIHLHGEKRES